MSYMSLFEKKVRYSNAIFILNDYRHYLKDDFKITNEVKEIILESLSLKNKDKYDSLIIYSFNVSKDLEKSATIELSEAIFQYLEMLKNKHEKEKYINLIKDSLTNGKELIQKDKNKIIYLVNSSIDFIFNQSKSSEETIGFEKMGL